MDHNRFLVKSFKVASNERKLKTELSEPWLILEYQSTFLTYLDNSFAHPRYGNEHLLLEVQFAPEPNQDSGQDLQAHGSHYNAHTGPHSAHIQLVELDPGPSNSEEDGLDDEPEDLEGGGRWILVDLPVLPGPERDGHEGGGDAEQGSRPTVTYELAAQNTGGATC